MKKKKISLIVINHQNGVELYTFLYVRLRIPLRRAGPAGFCGKFFSHKCYLHTLYSNIRLQAENGKKFVYFLQYAFSYFILFANCDVPIS